MRPSNTSSALSTMASTSASAVTSQATTNASRPIAGTSAATSSSAAVSRALSTTSAPSRASVVVIAAPMPFAAPVTIAFLPSSFIVVPFYSCMSATAAGRPDVAQGTSRACARPRHPPRHSLDEPSTPRGPAPLWRGQLQHRIPVFAGTTTTGRDTSSRHSRESGNPRKSMDCRKLHASGNPRRPPVHAKLREIAEELPSAAPSDSAAALSRTSIPSSGAP